MTDTTLRSSTRVGEATSPATRMQMSGVDADPVFAGARGDTIKWTPMNMSCIFAQQVRSASLHCPTTCFVCEV
jgi:hypothetical protein